MIRKLLGALCALAAFTTISASAQTPQLTAEMFARDENFSSPSLSPDGASVVLIQRVAGNNQAIVVVDWRTRQAQAVQSARRDRGLFLDWVIWKGDARLLFAVTQRIDWDGTPEDVTYRQIQRIYSVNRDGSNVQAMFEGQMRQLLNPDFAPIELIDALENDPDNVIIGTWAQNGYTAFRVNVTNGRATVIDDALGWDTSTVYVDGEGTPVLRTDPLANGAGYKFFRRPPHGGRWQLAYEVRRASVAQNRDFFPISAGPGPGQIYIAARPEGQEYQAVYLYDTSTGDLGAPVYAHANADAQGIQVDPTDNTLLAGCAETERWECRAVDPRMQRHFDAISVYFEGAADFSLISVSHDKTKWLIRANGPTIPPTIYVYDLSAASLTPVASTYPQLPRAQLAPTQVVHYASRDGAALWGYLTTPRNTTGPTPLVVLPHGGPESRDSYAFGYFEQYLASLGYAVFQPNFRGSEGSGRSFAIAGRRQWGLRMQDDITDGVRHLIAQGAVDPGRICIVGASYGGYAALAGGAFTPDLYRCVVSIAGDADLIEMLDQERLGQGRNSLGYAYWVAVTGDANADRDALIATSPARHAENFTAPVLLIHGRDDYTVRVEQSEAMRDALRRAGKQVEYLDFEHEGHYWSYWEPENRQRMLETVGRFLSQNNGPR